MSIDLRSELGNLNCLISPMLSIHLKSEDLWGLNPSWLLSTRPMRVDLSGLFAFMEGILEKCFVGFGKIS
jgi:hypothetical protein